MGKGIIDDTVDLVTVRELTKEYRDMVIKFRQYNNKTEKLSAFCFDGIISHAINLRWFAVKYKSQMVRAALEDIKYSRKLVSVYLTGYIRGLKIETIKKIRNEFCITLNQSKQIVDGVIGEGERSFICAKPQKDALESKKRLEKHGILILF